MRDLSQCRRRSSCHSDRRGGLGTGRLGIRFRRRCSDRGLVGQETRTSEYPVHHCVRETMISTSVLITGEQRRMSKGDDTRQEAQTRTERGSDSGHVEPNSRSSVRMTAERARAIQAHADRSGRNQPFKARAMSAADRTTAKEG